jgi:proteic killer suppression protein
MEIVYGSRMLEKAFLKKAQAVREWGPENAKKLLLRHEQLVAADNLEIFKALPGTGFHPLAGDRENQFACYGKHPYRLVFEPYPNPASRNADGVIDLRSVTKIQIIEVVDYHG